VEQTDPFSMLKMLNFRKYSFEELTHFSLGSNVIDAPHSNMWFSLEIYMCFLAFSG
jgi:hypothetical protein